MAIYMNIKGITGNVTAEGKYKGWIEINSMNFGVGRGINAPALGRDSNREASVASISEVQVSKLMDETTPLVFIEACIGDAKDVQIHLCRTGDNIKSYMEYSFSNVLISSYSVQASGEGDPYENLSLNFDKITMKYIPYKDGHTAGSPVPAGYDLASAKKV